MNMKNINLFIVFILLLTTQTTDAQVGIGTNTPNANAALELLSTTQGMLFPRMTTTQRDAIASPAKGLTIFNTTLNCIQTNVGTSAAANWKCLGISPTSNGTAIVSAYTCSTASAGSMVVGVAVSGVNQTITATVTTAGTYNISTTANGVIFAGSGTFTGTGAQNIVLTATGTPTTTGTFTFNLNTTPNCNFIKSIFQASTNGTAIVSGYTCSTSSSGSIIIGVVVSGVTQTITANVTSMGSYSISSLANGVTFAANGTFTNTGSQNIILTATGTPTAIGSNTFTLNTSPNCNFSRTTIINPSSNGTANVTSYSCSTASTGTMYAGTAASGVTQTITATVTTAGSYNISSTNNGVTFAGTGTFTGTGAQTIVLTATGTPIAIIPNMTFTLNTSPNCTFIRESAHASTNGTAIVSGYNCSNASAGRMTAGTAVSGVNQSITAQVTSVGTYNISTNTANGVKFSASGTFQTMGSLTIVLTATGTPIAAGSTNTFALNTTPNCSFNRTSDMATCGVLVANGVTKQFLCHNLGADWSLDPHVPVVGLQGAYIQWGRRGPNTTGDSRLDWQTAANTNNFAAAPTSANANANAIGGWSTNLVSNNLAWSATKSGDDPCPSGYRVPTKAEWIGMNTYNTASRTGTFSNSNTNYGSALHYGPNTSTKLLTLPAAGIRSQNNGQLNDRGNYGYYWTSTYLQSSNTAAHFFYFNGSVQGDGGVQNGYGCSIRCIEE
jgi:uncharacterized protein (TIGR02145 family)